MFKILVIAFTIFMASLAQAQYGARCGGTCIGTSDNQYHNAACAGASANGERGCQQYSGLGCMWVAQSQVPGRCVGTSGNQYYDAACAGASVNGERGCQQYSGLGCMWVAPFCR